MGQGQADLARQAHQRPGGQGLNPLPPTAEVTTVADDEVVVWDGTALRTYDGLAPGRVHELDGVEVRTLDRPGGELLCRFATVNDVHFGEVVCGHIDGFPGVDAMSVGPGERPYPDVMNEAAVRDIAAIEPLVVVAKGDLTASGTEAEYRAFLDCYEVAFGDALVHVRGNHDAAHGGTFAAWPTRLVELPGTWVAVLDTARPGRSSGRLLPDQVEWLDETAAEAGAAGVPLVVLGHHHPWDPDSPTREDDYFGIDPASSETLVAVVARRPSIVGYAAGHTHRNRVRRFAAAGRPVPFVEVACTKDFPGTWAEYRVYEGGILQIHRRITGSEALAWSERTRGLFGGLYPEYAFGSVADRCLAYGPA